VIRQGNANTDQEITNNKIKNLQRQCLGGDHQPKAYEDPSRYQRRTPLQS
jgi:hypothetical protein